MRSIDFVIVSLPRSGTHYTRRLFTGVGVSCGHEQYFNTLDQVYCDDKDSAFGDVSWFAAPFLGELPGSTVVLHQTRDRIKVVESLFLFDQRKNRIPGVLREDRSYAQFLKLHCPEVFECNSYEESLFTFYDLWTEKIKKHAVLTYNVEDLLDPQFTKSLIKRASGIDVPLETVDDVVATVSKSLATYGPPVKWAERYLKNKGGTE